MTVQSKNNNSVPWRFSVYKIKIYKNRGRKGGKETKVDIVKSHMLSGIIVLEMPSENTC